jgi:hypothetical protein
MAGGDDGGDARLHRAMVANVQEDDPVIYQDKNTVSQKTCHTAKCFQRMGFLASCGVTAFSSIETFIAHLFCAFF